MNHRTPSKVGVGAAMAAGWLVACTSSSAADDTDESSSTTAASEMSTSSGEEPGQSTGGTRSTDPEGTTTEPDPSSTTAVASTGSDETGPDESSTGPGVVDPPGDPVWVAVGNGALRMSTQDGAQWTMEGPEADLTLRGVGWGDGQFIAVGNGTLVMRSPDGVTWDEQFLPEDGQWLGAVAYGDGRWVAAGGVGRTYHSDDDGATWTRHETPLPGACRRLSYAEGRFVAVGDGGMIASSADGLTFEPHVQPDTERFTELAWSAGLWVAVVTPVNGNPSACFSSADGLDWTPCPVDATTRAVFAHPDGVVVTGDGGYWLATDTETFTFESTEAELPRHARFADQLWVGVRGDRLYSGSELDGLKQTFTEASTLGFALGWVPSE